MALSRDKLNSINGTEATNELMAYRAARKEKLAMDQIGTQISLETAAVLLGSGIVPPNMSKEAHQISDHTVVARPGDEFPLDTEENPTLN
ncbi:hypothetical protein A3F64_03280 [Candidatus Saccharibacteria bacterium RIFCSPHIGHO2_12_FULL_42_8]|nr:MAG: hypothetical protein A3F64_03280 [Candidatus Saccharibacteria bacterium RIFCSPHIGHO2_12_FULL_42_8]